MSSYSSYNPVFSICKLKNSWLWVAWDSPKSAKEFFFKTNKSLLLDCLFYRETSSREEAVKQALKTLGSSATEIKTEWAIEASKLLENSSNIVEQNESNNSLNNLHNTNNKTVIDNLENDLENLNSLIGLAGVKSTVKELVNIAKISQLKAEAGLKPPQITRHLVFTGNPGTGKTTVARIIGTIYQKLNILSKGHFIEVDRTDLVAEYLGQTAPKTTKVVESALGGVLFIDEAYSLVPEDRKDMYGQEAISTLLKMMEDNRDDLVVIVAGYKEDMKRFINSNPGLKSRFSKSIDFPNYSSEELGKIFELMSQGHGYIMENIAKQKINDLFSEFQSQIGELGNGRFVRNIFDRCIANQCNRLATLTNQSKQDLITFQLDDIPTSEQLREFLLD
jgi:SpoVK/Ycf46/Vps4 family AAA+-type ATPase